MPRHLDRDLDDLQRRVDELAGLVQQAIADAVESLRSRDGSLARQVVAGDSRIDLGQNQLEERCLLLLALHQPVASDLRQVAASMQAATELERMGDLAEKIAGRTIALVGLPPMMVPAGMVPMADAVLTMVRQAAASFLNLDANLAQSVCQQDDEVDHLNDEVIADLVRLMRTRPEHVEAGISLFSVTRHLERIADHATNIAEGVLYRISGEIVRHSHALRSVKG